VLFVSGTPVRGTCDAAGLVLAAEALAVKLLRFAGIATVIAAGNNSAFDRISEPACLSDAIAVANSEEDRATYLENINPTSNYSSLVKLVAPGTDILGAIPGDGSKRDTGTSFAAPLVAGAFALLKEAKPSAAVSDIEGALACTGKLVFKNRLPKPRIDLIEAYDYLLQPGATTRNWDFSNPQQAFDWFPVLGQWLPKGGQYIVTPMVPGVGAMTADPNNGLPKSLCLGSSFTLEATMARIYPNDPKATIFPGAGIIQVFAPRRYRLYFRLLVRDQSAAATGRGGYRRPGRRRWGQHRALPRAGTRGPPIHCQFQQAQYAESGQQRFRIPIFHQRDAGL
jgi:hypothetical protein